MNMDLIAVPVLRFNLENYEDGSHQTMGVDFPAVRPQRGVARYRGSDLTTTETTVVKMSATAARNHRSDVNECYGTELQQIARDLVAGSRKGSQ